MDANRPESARIGPPEPNARQEAVAVLMASGATAAAAAKRAGVGERTVKTWMAGQALPARIDQLRGELTSQALGVLIRGMTGAAGVLVEIATDDGQPAQVRVRAASEILNRAMQLRDVAELARRLDALESAAGGAA